MLKLCRPVNSVKDVQTYMNGSIILLSPLTRHFYLQKIIENLALALVY